MSSSDSPSFTGERRSAAEGILALQLVAFGLVASPLRTVRHPPRRDADQPLAARLAVPFFQLPLQSPSRSLVTSCPTPREWSSHDRCLSALF